MWNMIWSFWCENWLDISMIIVGASAFITYWLQGRRKISEAASLIIMQVDELQKRMREIGTYIADGQLSDIAFYESQILFKTDYWDQYKHHFVRKMDPSSLITFDEFFSCASEVKEQQELMKSLQKNDFFLNQQTIVQMEANAVLQALNSSNQTPIDKKKVINTLVESLPKDLEANEKQAMENMMKYASNFSSDPSFDIFWNLYNKDKDTIVTAFNRNAFTRYTPVQIRLSLEKALKQFASIPIVGCQGYNKLKKLAERKF